MSRVDDKSASRLMNVGCTTWFWLFFRIVSIEACRVKPVRPRLASDGQPLREDSLKPKAPFESRMGETMEPIMTKVTIAEEIAERIRRSEGPIELVDSHGQTIGVVRGPPSEAEIERARNRASKDGKRLSWAQVVAKIRDGVVE